MNSKASEVKTSGKKLKGKTTMMVFFLGFFLGAETWETLMFTGACCVSQPEAGGMVQVCI